jgi:fatty-acid desaturase
MWQDFSPQLSAHFYIASFSFLSGKGKFSSGDKITNAWNLALTFISKGS